MLWVEALALFLVSRLVGDFIFQTDWQARHKRGDCAATRARDERW
jgi:hypothetical protein